MSEISREECINTINKWLSCKECDTDECLSSRCADCKNYYDGYKVIISLKQAISDMEKLEKIEQIINNWDSDNPRDIIHWEKIRMIEQIVKE